MRAALLSNDETAMNLALAPLAGISIHLEFGVGLLRYGAESEATDSTMKFKLRMEIARASIEDADMTEAIVELQQLKFSQQAAMDVRGKIPKTSLFDCLG